MLDPARMDATSRPQCLEGTRTALLQSLIADLTTATPETNVLWLYGVAGSGKSTISTTMAEWLHDRGQRGPFLFFNRNSPSQSSPDGVIRTLAYQLALANSVLRDAICDAIEKDTEIATRPLDAQFKALVLEPLRSCSSNLATPIVIILDAFDECGDAKSRRALVYLLTTHLPLLPLHFRFLITGRPELDLINAFGSHPGIKSVSLNSVEWSSAADVLRYIQHELNMLYRDRGVSDELPLGWPGAQTAVQLGSRADDSFIWAATSIRYLSAADDLDERLHRLLSQQAFSLGDLYATALRSACNWEPSEASTENCLKILGAVIVGRIPLTDDTIDNMLDLRPSKSCRPILRKLGCLLQWSEGLPVRTLHASFADYLTDYHACGGQPWFIDKSKHHADFTMGCLHVMKRFLRFNICGLKTSYLLNRDVHDLAERIKSAIPPSLAYACRFWSEHLRNTNTFDHNIRSLILEFFKVFFLYWLEVLSLIGEGRAALEAMVVVESRSSDHGDPVHGFAKDGIKFVSAFASVIADSAPHVYISTLPFAPSISVISQCYSSIIKNTLHVTNSTRMEWPSCEQVIEGHTSKVYSVAFSPDGERVASGSWDSTIRIWDARTGKIIAEPFKWHTDSVTSVVFSPGGERIASASYDKTVRIWDAHTGELVAGPFEGHADWVRSVAFSPDGERVTSGSNDGTIRIWNARTGTVLAATSKWHEDSVTSVVFSPGGERIASASYDKTVRIWDARTGELVAGPFEGHTDWVRSVAFSPDGERVASGSDDNTVCIWDACTGELVAGPLEGHTDWVRSVVFSPDGERIASGSDDNTIRIWDARTSELVTGPFEGHTDWVRSVAFSPGGERVASGSWDNTIRIWDAHAGKLVTSPFKWHTDSVTSVVFSPGGERIASASYDKTVRIWDARTGELVAGPFEGHTERVRSVAFSPDGERVASGSNDGTIRIWNARTGELIAGPFERSADWVRSVAFSPDGERIALGLDNGNICIWDTHTGELVAGPFKGHTGPVYLVAFSPDDERVASGSDDNTIRIWDVCTGKLVAGPFEGHTDWVRSVTFSPDGGRVASGSDDNTIRIWDARTGELVAGPFEGHADWVRSVAFSPDGERIASGSNDGTIRVWNARMGTLLGAPYEYHTASVTSVTFSPDGEHLASGSDDMTIRIFEMGIDASCHTRESQSYPSSSSHLANGWMQNSPTELIFWVPPEYRTGLWQPSDTVVIGQLSNCLDLTRFVYGDNWAQCHV
ncbi:WD40 repeat-like protein [Athelia psychrophila]|uniref:WD40 repeat-like protein n=1 Tax=Athelia psychrophila TaxID=1759441 RepID=A0A167WWX5_9AGAM|nr:WD40 repeat-like protein [Fibularhizoctonia sp. CBS 109695]